MSKAINFDLLPHQGEFVNSTARYVLNSGGVGSGKTYSLVLRTLKLCLENAGIFILVGAQTFPLLRDTTLREWEAIIPKELITVHNKTRSYFQLANGSEVIFRPLDEASKIKSYNLGAVAVEELTDVTEEMFKMLRTRLRQPGMPGSFYGATNPGSFNSWVYKAFIENPIEGSQVVYSQSVDNDYLPAEYLTDLSTLEKSNPEYYSRMVLGQWGNLEGVIYLLPYTQRVERQDLPKQYKKIIAGLDFGFSHPSALVVLGELDGKFYVLDEFYEYKLTAADIIDRVQDKVKQWDIDEVFCDGARPEIIFDMQKAGLPARAAKKGAGSVFDGIMYVKGLIGSERLSVCKDCTFTLREFDSYIWDQGASVEKPIDQNNHAMDAVRYALTMARKQVDKTLQIVSWT